MYRDCQLLAAYLCLVFFIFISHAVLMFIFKSKKPVFTVYIQYAARESDRLNIFRATALHAVAEAKGAWTKY